MMIMSLGFTVIIGVIGLAVVAAIVLAILRKK